MIKSVLLGAALGVSLVGLQAIPTSAPAAVAALAPCQGTDVFVVDDAPVGCDVVQPQRLHVIGVSYDDAMDMGAAWYMPVIGIAFDVDY